MWSSLILAKIAGKWTSWQNIDFSTWLLSWQILKSIIIWAATRITGPPNKMKSGMSQEYPVFGFIRCRHWAKAFQPAQNMKRWKLIVQIRECSNVHIKRLNYKQGTNLTRLTCYFWRPLPLLFKGTSSHSVHSVLIYTTYSEEVADNIERYKKPELLMGRRTRIGFPVTKRAAK